MIQSSISTPKTVLFTTVHGETVSASLISLYAGAGFACDTVNLAEQDIDPNAVIIVCSDPQTDFSYAEVDKINNYMAQYATEHIRLTVTFTTSAQNIPKSIRKTQA